MEGFYVSNGEVEFAAEFRAVFAFLDSVLSGRDNSTPNSVAPRYESLSGGIWGSTFQLGEDGGTAREAAKGRPVDVRRPRRDALIVRENQAASAGRSSQPVFQAPVASTSWR
jgi:hypothetical protein